MLIGRPRGSPLPNHELTQDISCICRYKNSRGVELLRRPCLGKHTSWRRSSVYRTLAQVLWKPLSLLLAGIGLFLAYLLLKPVPSAQFTFGDNLLQGALEVVGLLLALPILVPASTRSLADKSAIGTINRPLHWPRWLARWTSPGSVVPLLLACTLLSYVIGQMLWTLNEDVLHLAVLFPSWADAGYLGSYPFALLAILLLPQQRLS